MGVLRTDIISHSQLTDGNASVLFDGTTDSITIPSTSAFAFGTGDWTVEMFVNFTSLSGQQTLVGDTYGATAGWYLYKQNNHRLGVYYSSLLVDGNTLIEADRWYHLAFVRHSGRTSIYIDGELDAEAADTTNATITQYYIGDTADQSSGEFFGNISNLRITRTAVYTTEFTVPKFKLKETPGTILLCCQSSSSTTEATVSVPGTLTANGDPTATAFGPGLKEDITDTGVVFDGVTTFDSQAYFVPPSGKTTERNRGRAVIGWANNPVNTGMDVFNIQSSGNTTGFGNLTTGNKWGSHAFSSTTRGLWAGGYLNTGTTFYNTIEFVTIANNGNPIDFGDTTTASYRSGCCSSSTRGLIALGYVAPNFSIVNTIDQVTMVTAGNATNFGDLSQTRANMSSTSSPTRGIFAGGVTPANQGTIDFVTIASAGDAQDFGDLQAAVDSSMALASTTRGIIGGGYPSPANTNIINFITIASAGNAQDFGDLTGLYSVGSAVSNKTRGVFCGGYTAPSKHNLMEFVTISTTGNASDFGDMTYARRDFGACSDSHGGLS